MKNESTLDWLEQLTRHSRHYDTSLHLVTQELSDFLVNEQAKTIANNCSQKILHRLPNLDPAHAEALDITESEAAFVRDALPGDPEREFSHALVSVDDGPTLPTKIWAYPKEERIIEGETANERGAAGKRARADGGGS